MICDTLDSMIALTVIMIPPITLGGKGPKKPPPHVDSNIV